ncbi:hypothetical protein DSO57_1031366 [Entomophthora muscae]|uniref:Uncharacterized protein n=1 Tax=Entomophthora muscae TaxID=34485 RepID=A0ACC2T0P0_9FUNG|nr:hypothetical protein DSO57_1031366 [Entomophthora muscae]
MVDYTNFIFNLEFSLSKVEPQSSEGGLPPQDGPGLADLLSHGLELLNYPTTHQLNNKNSLNGCQIATKLVPLKAHTCTGDVDCLKEVGKGPTISPANKYQLLPVPSPEREMQLACSGNMMNHSSKIKHCHSCFPEQPQPGPAALKTLSQDTCPASKPPMDLKSAKSKEAKSHVLVIFHLNSGQVDNQATRQLPPLDTNLLTCLRHYTAPLEPPLDLCILLDTCPTLHTHTRTREIEYIRCRLKWYKKPPRLFKDKYNDLPAYFVHMTPPLTPRPDLPMKPSATAETTSTQLFGVLYITLTGLMDSMVPNSEPWSLLGQSVSYIIKLAPILWWALPTSLATPRPEQPNASIYAWLPER